MAKEEYKEAIIIGTYNPQNNVFTMNEIIPIDKNSKPKRRFHLMRNFFGRIFDEIIEPVAYHSSQAAKRVRLMVISMKEGIGIKLFCDNEGLVYFYDTIGLRYYISEDNSFALSEDGNYFRIEFDEGEYWLAEVPRFEKAFPFKTIYKAKEEGYDFGDDDDFLDMLGAEEDPFASELPKSSKIIDFEAAMFIRDREEQRRR